MIGTILVMPASNKTENELLGGTSFSASADTVESGSCGEDATWTLDANGKLTWEDKTADDFMPAKATQCHVQSDALDAFNTKFGGSVNVTFAAAE